MIKITFGLFDEGIDLFQPFQIPHGRGEEQAESEIYIVGEPFAPFLLIAHKVHHHRRLVVAHSDGHVTLVYDTQRHGGVRCARAYFFHVRDTQNGEHPSIVVFVAGPLVGIANVGKEVVGYVEFLFQHIPVFVRGASHLYPAARLPLLECSQFIGNVPVGSHRCLSPQ